MIKGLSEMLTLCEVQVFGHPGKTHNICLCELTDINIIINILFAQHLCTDLYVISTPMGGQQHGILFYKILFTK